MAKASMKESAALQANCSAQDVHDALKASVETGSDPTRFFKTGAGQYAEEDLFLGVKVPNQRTIAKQFRDLPIHELRKLIASKWHECRLTALLILVLQFERAKEPLRRELVDFYLANLDHVNNWDLVDSSAQKILGAYALEVAAYRKQIEQLATSGALWRERVAIISTQVHIKKGDFQLILKLAKQFLNHQHDLIHKAVGWMLREMGQRELQPLISFLDKNAPKMPRTMLRYAIEKLPAEQRKLYLER